MPKPQQDELIWPQALTQEIADSWPGKSSGVEPLYGDSDLNVLIRYGDGSRRILKISESGSQQAAQLIELQVAMLLHIQGRTSELACPVPVASLADRHVQEVQAGDGTTHHAWMLDWLPGQVLDGVVAYDESLLHSIGRSMALIDNALLDFDHQLAHRRFSWDVANILELRDWLNHIREHDDRQLATRVFERVAENLMPRLAQRPAGIIHNDGGNQHNMLVQDIPGAGLQVTGVIDFGDSVYTQRICELGIAAAYATFGSANLTGAISSVAAGYHNVLPLEEIDQSLLPWLVMARFLMSVCHAAERASREPDNDYAQVSAVKAWAGLRTILSLDMQQISDQIAERINHG